MNTLRVLNHVADGRQARAVWLAMAVGGCATALPAPAEEAAAPLARDMNHEDDGIHLDTSTDKDARGDRSALSGSAEAAGTLVRQLSDGADAQCAAATTSGATALEQCILRHLGPQLSGTIGTLACRAIRGGSAPSVHAAARALDVLVPMLAGARRTGSSRTRSSSAFS